MRITCGTFPFQYPLMPSLLPMAMNAGIKPPLAAACAAALCWLAPEICMMIFSRSSGAVHVFASAPAVPPARNSASPVPMTCATTAIGRRSIRRFTVSFGEASSFASFFDAAASSPNTGTAPRCTNACVTEANLFAPPRNAREGTSVAPLTLTERANAAASTRRGTAMRRPRLGVSWDIASLANGIAGARGGGRSIEHPERSLIACSVSLLGGAARGRVCAACERTRVVSRPAQNSARVTIALSDTLFSALFAAPARERGP